MSSLSPLRVAPGGRYFQTFDGEPFLILGANDAIPWPGLAPLLHHRDLNHAENYLRSFSENGATMLRLMLEYAHHDGTYLENPVGHFAPEMVRFWDDLFDLGEKLGLRFLLAPWDNFWMWRRWEHHPYNAKNGGPAETPAAFFTDEATIQATMNRLEWFARRYANRAVIGAWDLFNEIWTNWGGDPHSQGEVIARQSRALRDVETEVQGWTRPQTVSIYGPNPSNGYENLIFNHPELDFSTTHIYWSRAIDFPRDTVASAVAMGRWTRFGLEQTPEGRPFTDSEHGPIHLFNDKKRMLPLEFDEEYERHLMWAHLASGGAGSGMRWPARHPHVLTEGMKAAFKPIREFARFVDWNSFAPRDWRSSTKLEGAGSRFAHRFAIGDGKQAVIWLLRRRPRDFRRGVLPSMEPLAGDKLALRGMEPGPRRVTFMSSKTGEVRGQIETSVVRNVLRVEIPAWEHELAIAIR